MTAPAFERAFRKWDRYDPKWGAPGLARTPGTRPWMNFANASGRCRAIEPGGLEAPAVGDRRRARTRTARRPDGGARHPRRWPTAKWSPSSSSPV